MDWFFDQWVYRMGHPVFNVTQAYDPAAKQLSLKVKQEQKPDPASQYPQAGFFRAPVEIEIGTSNGTRVEHVTVEPKEEQTFVFTVDAEPVLVNFDYHDTLIKELKFDKSSDQLAYQLAHDDDVVGRVWALGQLSAKMKEGSTPEAEKQKLSAAIVTALGTDKFWGTRFEAAGALAEASGDAVRTALAAATKDPNARVRAHAIESLAKSKDASLATLYLQCLGDPSYGVITAAAHALGETKNPAAYEALAKLLDVPSWRENVRVAGLDGLAALGDRRALDIALRYSSSGNPARVRGEALLLLASVGKDNPEAFSRISTAFMEAVSTSNRALGAITSKALVDLGDPRAVEVVQEARKLNHRPGVDALLAQLELRLKQTSQAAGTKPNAQ
jgi:aminopeptidase N